MALSEAILVCLADEPLSGYDLTKTFAESIGFFWHADHQQVYRVLRRLADDGLVSVEHVVQQGRPNKKVYSITPAGRERLLAWSREDHPAASVKDDLLVTLYGLEHADIAAVRAQVAARLDDHRRRLALYERIQDVTYRDVDPHNAREAGRLLGLHLGLVNERGWITWCDSALERLDLLSTEQQNTN